VSNSVGDRSGEFATKSDIIFGGLMQTRDDIALESLRLVNFHRFSSRIDHECRSIRFRYGIDLARSFSEMNIEIFGMTNFIIYTD